MNNPFGSSVPQDPGSSRPAASARSGRPRTILITGVVLAGCFVLLSFFASFWTERMWYRALGFGGVFSTLLWTRVGLFLIFGGLMAATVAASTALAYRFRPFYRPSVAGGDGLDRYRDAVTPIFGWLLGGMSAMMGVFAGMSAAGHWRTYALWRHGTSFGTEDPYFHKDAGFYVFDLPWWHFVVDFLLAMAVVGLLAAVIVHYLYGGIRLAGPPGGRISGAAQVQFSVLLAIFVLVKAADYWLDRYDLVNGSGGLFTGMGYTDNKAVLPAKEILAGIAIVCAVLFLLNLWRRTWMLPSLGIALMALSSVLLSLIVPGVVQQLQVSPNVPDKEGPFIKANIDATRQAFELDKIDVQPYAAGESNSVLSGQLAHLDGVTSSVPLVDPKIVSQTFEQQQQVRAYYSVNDVLDVDRYQIDGVDRALVLGVRELDQNGINDTDKNWINLHTVYTHGSGVIAAYANQRPQDDKAQATTGTQWAEGQETDEDALTKLDGGYRTGIYFGELSPAYSVVGKRPGGADVELDLPRGEKSDVNQTSTYDGLGGVPIGNIFEKLLFAVKFSEPNLVLSERVHSDSKILYDRHPRTMVEKVAPWLTVDGDPYPAVIDGRIVWILDGYTVTDRYPLSQRGSLEEMTDDSLQQQTGFQTLPTDEINYMRNAVKATVDAYDGTVTLYEWDSEDPILKAWEEVFPGVVKPKEAIPETLKAHLRYPDDLFKVQRYQFQRYHETNAKDWYDGATRWAVPKDPESAALLQPPYRLFTEGDGSGAASTSASDTTSEQSAEGTSPSGAETWSLTSVYVWPKRDKLAAFMGVDSDARSPNYGKIVVLELPNEATDGPRLIANTLSTNDRVRDKLLPYTNGDAKPIYGNLLTLPVAEDFMYVQPLYTKRDSESAFPVLSFVLVSYKGEVGIGETLTKAIADALGVDSTSPTPTPAPTPEPGDKTDEPQQPQGVNAQIRELLARAEAKFKAADAAQAKGDTVAWAQNMEAARKLIDKAVKLAG